MNWGEKIKAGISVKGATWKDASTSNTELSLHALILSRINWKIVLEEKAAFSAAMMTTIGTKEKKIGLLDHTLASISQEIIGRVHKPWIHKDITILNQSVTG